MRGVPVEGDAKVDGGQSHGDGCWFTGVDLHGGNPGLESGAHHPAKGKYHREQGAVECAGIVSGTNSPYQFNSLSTQISYQMQVPLQGSRFLSVGIKKASQTVKYFRF